MNRRRVIVAVANLILLASVGVALLLVPRRAPLARAYDRLDMGMTPGEVNKMIGPQPIKVNEVIGPQLKMDKLAYNEKVRRLQWNEVVQLGQAVAFGEGSSVTWVDEDHLIDVGFDSAGRLVYKRLMAARPPTLFDRFRRWLGL